MNIIVGGVIKNNNGQYLLVKENKKEFYGMYNIPAGHLDQNEILFDGAKREIKEETGYDVEFSGIVQIGNTKDFISFIFCGTIKSKQGIYDKEEIASTEWFTFDEIVNLRDKLRSSDLLIDAVKSVEDNKVYSLDLIKGK